MGLSIPNDYMIWFLYLMASVSTFVGYLMPKPSWLKKSGTI